MQNMGQDMTKPEEVWPPPIQRSFKVTQRDSRQWVRRFAFGISFVYVFFIPFLFCLLVPSVRDSIEQFELHRDAPPYDLAFFRFTAGCFVVTSIIGGAISGSRFLLAASRHDSLLPSVIGLIASLLPGSVSYYLAYLEFGLS